MIFKNVESKKNGNKQVYLMQLKFLNYNKFIKMILTEVKNIFGGRAVSLFL